MRLLRRQPEAADKCMNLINHGLIIIIIIIKMVSVVIQ